MSTNTLPEEVATPPSEGLKTAGEAAFAYDHIQSTPTRVRWCELDGESKSFWEGVAKAAIAHHEASKERPRPSPQVGMGVGLPQDASIPTPETRVTGPGFIPTWLGATQPASASKEVTGIPTVDELHAIHQEAKRKSWVRGTEMEEAIVVGIAAVREAMLKAMPTAQDVERVRKLAAEDSTAEQRKRVAAEQRAQAAKATELALRTMIHQQDKLLGYIGVEMAGTHHQHIADKTLEMHRKAMECLQAGSGQHAKDKATGIPAKSGDQIVSLTSEDCEMANLGDKINDHFVKQGHEDWQLGNVASRKLLWKMQARAESAEAQLASLKSHLVTAEQERDNLQGWKESMLKVESWWSKVDEFIRNHPKAPMGQNVSDIALQWLRAYSEQMNKP